jgi:hypothetical protein
MSTALALDTQTVPKYIYNHDIMNCTADGVMGNYLYSGRALGITEPWDMIQLHEALMPQWQDICAHYDRIGLRHTKSVSWFLNLKEIGSHIGYQPSVFYFGTEEYKNWGDLGWYNTVEFINSKNNFMKLAKELRIDVPETLCFDNITEIHEAALDEITYPCYLKAAISVSGVGIYRCENKSALKQNLRKFSAKTPVQIQEEILSDIFLNIQYQVVGDTLRRLETSEQVLEGFVHQGNRVPACCEPWETVEPMAIWLKEQGIKDIFAFDIAVVDSERGPRFPVIECNPRFNGASYPTLVAQKLGIKEWSCLTFSTKYRDLRYIQLFDIEYSSTTGEGAILINWGTVLVGKLMILLAGSKQYQEALKIELEARL